MNIKIEKMNNYLLNKHNKVFISFSISIFILSIIYVYFLFMSVSYTYASEKKSYLLNTLITENVENKNYIFKKELESESKLITKNFVNIEKIKYINRTNPVVVKLSK